MKTPLNILFLFLFLESPRTIGQQIFVYDQQSSVEGQYREGGADIQPLQPLGQSFTPTLDSVGFVRLYLYDRDFMNGLGATLHVNLRANSITGPILGATDSVTLPNRFAGPTDFFFSTPVPLTPGMTYFFQPIVQSGDQWGLNTSDYNYSGGTAFFSGEPSDRNWDFWFREGVVVPEPSSVVLIAFGIGGILWVSRKHLRTHRHF